MYEHAMAQLQDFLSPESRVQFENPRHNRRGKLNPRLVAFNKMAASKNLEKKVRTWVHTQHHLDRFKDRIFDIHRISANILDEARTRVIQFKEDSLTALSSAAILTTISYRTDDVPYDVLKAEATQAFEKYVG